MRGKTGTRAKNNYRNRNDRPNNVHPPQQCSHHLFDKKLGRARSGSRSFDFLNVALRLIRPRRFENLAWCIGNEVSTVTSYENT